MNITFKDLEAQRTEMLAKREQALTVLHQTEGALAMLDVMLAVLNKPEEPEPAE